MTGEYRRIRDRTLSEKTMPRRRATSTFSDDASEDDESKWEPTSMQMAEALQDRRTNKRTKRVYESKLNVMTEYMQEHHPESVNGDGLISLPLTYRVIIYIIFFRK